MAVTTTRPLLVYLPSAERIPRFTVKTHISPILAMTAKSCIFVRASDPRRLQEEEEEDISRRNNDKSSSDFSSLKKEDWKYVWNLGVVSVVGAVIVKYGSLVFPEITKPNIIQALTMVSAPVLAAVLIMLKESRHEE